MRFYASAIRSVESSPCQVLSHYYFCCFCSFLRRAKSNVNLAACFPERHNLSACHEGQRPATAGIRATCSTDAADRAKSTSSPETAGARTGGPGRQRSAAAGNAAPAAGCSRRPSGAGSAAAADIRGNRTPGGRKRRSTARRPRAARSKDGPRAYGSGKTSCRWESPHRRVRAN